MEVNGGVAATAVPAAVDEYAADGGERTEATDGAADAQFWELATVGI